MRLKLSAQGSWHTNGRGAVRDAEHWALVCDHLLSHVYMLSLQHWLLGLLPSPQSPLPNPVRFRRRFPILIPFSCLLPHHFFCSSFHILVHLPFPFSPTGFKHLNDLKCKTGNTSPLFKTFKGSPVPRNPQLQSWTIPKSKPHSLKFLPPQSRDSSSTHSQG